ncbi:unnamed protein product [Adineta steineri]|uniref:VWFA domain-containing protein n=1 Tax=Adineta steineri TaxID=433720 RepID=A0A814QWQ5_9BILA|nr:unnamed protein product [Adineta steineri]CAF1125648.1 unnamed protein product [Adineta steineri]
MLQILEFSHSVWNKVENPKFVPLKKVHVNASIRSFAVDVTIEQVFRNDETTAIEAVYCFPMEEQAAIYAFIARIDDREIRAKLKKKDEAQQEYVHALRKGHGAYLLEQDEKSPDNFIVNVGALPPGKQCEISISYVSELDLINDGSTIRFVVPTTIAPRYNPCVGDISSPCDTTSKYVQSSPYTIELCCRVEKKNIAQVSSKSHPIEVHLNEPDAYVIRFAQENTHLDRDIIIDLELSEHQSNTILTIEVGAIMASFTPTNEECKRVMEKMSVANEFIFVVDCSGSMGSENKIGLLRSAMKLLIEKIPSDSIMNIIRFGSDYESLFGESRSLNADQNRQEARRFVECLEADMGGTELASPLDLLRHTPPKEGSTRQIFLLTDGEVSNVDKVLDICRAMSTSTRIFSFGLGYAPSRALVKGLARVTNGRFVFIPPNTTVHKYVDTQFQKSIQMAITNAEIKWNTPTPMINAPSKIPPIFANDRLLVYGLCESSETTFDRSVSVELYHGTVQLGFASIQDLPNVNNVGTLARLAAKALILELEHSKYKSLEKKQEIQEKIVKLSLTYNILCPYTAFIAVEKRLNSSNDEMVLREVPIEISADDKHLAMLAMNDTSRSLCVECGHRDRVMDQVRCHCCQQCFCGTHMMEHSENLEMVLNQLRKEMEDPHIEALRNVNNRSNWLCRLYKWYASVPEHPLVDQFYKQCTERCEKWSRYADREIYLTKAINDAEYKLRLIIDQNKKALDKWSMEAPSTERSRKRFQSKRSLNERQESLFSLSSRLNSPSVYDLIKRIERLTYESRYPTLPYRNYSYVKEDEGALDTNLSSRLMPAHKSFKTTTNQYYCMAANDKYIVLEQFHLLNLITGDYNSDLYHEWRHFVTDIFWSNALEKFIVINIDCINVLDVDNRCKRIYATTLDHDLDNRIWWCGTSSNNTLLLSKAMEGTSLFEYTLKPKIAFVKEHHSPISCKKDEFICSMSSTATVLALMIIKQNSEVRLDLCSLSTLERQRSIEVDSTYLTHPFRSCSVNGNQWILVNPNQSELWYISEDGDVNSKENYIGTPLQVAFMGTDTLVVLTTERINIHRLSPVKADATS